MVEGYLKHAYDILQYLRIKPEQLPDTLLDEELDESYSPEGESEEDRVKKHYDEDSISSIKTVRFLKDYPRYNARPDLTTKNVSFLKTAEVFKNMGIKNCYFHLQLNNPALVGVDPHDPNLTDDQRLMVLQEMSENFWYFLREVCRLSGGVQFRGNRANISFAWCWLNHLTSILIMPRQQGKTVTAQVISFWLTYISGRAYTTHLITLKDDNRQQFVDAVKGIRSSIPSWMTNVIYRDKDAGNSLSYAAFGEKSKNKLVISVPQIGKEAACNVGRGLTTESRFFDEPSYIKWMEAILNGAGPSTLTARENARKKKWVYGTGFITTPASKLTESGLYMYTMLMNATEWRESYFDTFSETHLYKQMIKNSNEPGVTSPTVGMVYNYLQLGKNKDWVKRTIDELKMSKSEAKIDLLLMWDEDGKDRLFSDDVREAINEAKRGIEWSQLIGNTDLYFDWFIPQTEYVDILAGRSNTHYLIGVDTSAAQGRDACTVVIRDIRTGYVIGCGRYQRAFLTDVGIVIQTLLQEMNNSTLIIERNYATHMIDQLLVSLPSLGIDPFKRIFNQIFQAPEKYSREYSEIKARGFNGADDRFYLKYKQHFGFMTTPESRRQLYDGLEPAVSITGEGIRYTKLIDELIGLKVINGRIDHDSKGHDDLVIAWLLSFWFIKHAQNKNEYNIPPGIGLVDAKLLRFGERKTEVIDELAERREKLYRAKIQEITDKLMDCDNDIIAARYEQVLDKLHSVMPAEAKRTITIDDIKRQASEARKKRAMDMRRNRHGWAA